MNFEDSDFDLQKVSETIFISESWIRSKKLPSPRRFSPCGIGDYSGIASGILELAKTASCGYEGIGEAVKSYIETGKWGRPKVNVAFWLKEFLQIAILYFLSARKTQPYADCTLYEPATTLPDKSNQAVLEWLLKERWDEYLCPLWIKHNALHYCFVESWDMSLHTELQEEKFREAFGKIPDSHFLWTPSGSFYQNHKDEFPYNYFHEAL